MAGARLRVADGLLLTPAMFSFVGLAVWMLTEAPGWLVWTGVTGCSLAALSLWAALPKRRSGHEPRQPALVSVSERR